VKESREHERMSKRFSIIVAVDSYGGIGKNGSIPWNCPEDRKHFAKTTTESSSPNKMNALITYESLPIKPLSRRITIVVSSTETSADVTCGGLDEALKWCDENAIIVNNIFVCGGVRLYNEAMAHPRCTSAYMTMVNDVDHTCDTIWTNWQIVYDQRDGWVKEKREIFIDTGVSISSFVRTNLSEKLYLDLLGRLMNEKNRSNRTQVSTKSLFSQNLRYPLCGCNDQKILPLFTTKFVPFATVYKELLWFLSGSTSTKQLSLGGVKIWDGNTSREYLDAHGFKDYEEGELGPGYGFQWRRFGEMYKSGNNTGTKVVDQIDQVIKGIREDPFSRRHVVTAWNPSQLHQVALPPCHLMFCFYVHDSDVAPFYPKYLSCAVTIRSNDMFLGHPFNVASYALLTHMIAKLTGLHGKELTINMIDCHLYTSHESEVTTQISREPYGYPTIEFVGDIKNIDDFKFESVKLHGYTHDTKLTSKMVV
jgi:thymidylate synthase